jgi:AbrB family looped-hinge helix DNA binding protein
MATVTSVTKVGPKGQVVIPKKVRDEVHLKPGDLVEATTTNGQVVLRPKVLVDRGLEEALAEAEADVKAGRVSKPFTSVREFVRIAKEHGRRARPRH